MSNPYLDAAKSIFTTNPKQWTSYHWVIVSPFFLVGFVACNAIFDKTPPRTCETIRAEVVKLEQQQLELITAERSSPDANDKYKSLQVEINQLKFEAQDKKCY